MRDRLVRCLVHALRGRKGLALTGVILSLAPLLGTTKASAVTINSYSFTQGGYSDGGSLSGNFEGIVEANGFIELADLISIYVDFSTPLGQGIEGSVFGYGPASFFSFDTIGGSSSLDLETGIGINGFACVGAVAAFGFGECGSGGVNGFEDGFGVATTQALPVVTLTSSVTTVPEPSTWAAMVIGFAGLGLVRYRSRKAAALAA